MQTSTIDQTIMITHVQLQLQLINITYLKLSNISDTLILASTEKSLKFGLLQLLTFDRYSLIKQSLMISDCTIREYRCTNAKFNTP